MARPWWHYLVGAIIAVGIGAGIGYAMGAPNSEDARRIMERNERVARLKSNMIIIPTLALSRTQNGQGIYNEAIGSYLSGTPNGAFDNIMKVLEITLRKKYEEVEGKPAPTDMNLKKLIDWAEKYLRSDKGVAHKFRTERKGIHFDTSTPEPYALDAITRISNMLNMLYPYETAIIFYTCPTCKRQEQFNLNKSNNYLGNVINNLRCVNNAPGTFNIVINL